MDKQPKCVPAIQLVAYLLDKMKKHGPFGVRVFVTEVQVQVSKAEAEAMREAQAVIGKAQLQ